MKRRGKGKRHHSKKSGSPRRRRSASRKAPRSAGAAHVVVVENPRPIMSKKRRRRSRRRSHRKHNPAPHRRRRRRGGHVGKRRHHRHGRRRNPGMGPMASALLAVGVGGLAAIVGSVGSSKLQAALPTSAPSWTGDALRIGAGVVAAAALAKKHPPIAAGIGVGLGAPAAVKLVTPLLPQALQALVSDDGSGALPMGDYIRTDVQRLGQRIGALEAVLQEAVTYAD